MKTLLSLFVGIALLPVLNCSADVKIEEQIVGPAQEPGTIYWLSPKGLSLATVHPKGSRFVVTLNDVEGTKFDEVIRAAGFYYKSAAINRDNDFNLEKSPAPVVFSPDGLRHAYAARIGKEIVVMLDGKEIYRTPDATPFEAVALLNFSPDSKHLFFYRRTPETMDSHRLMMDGQPVTPSFQGTPAPFFSGDGKRWGLLARKPLQIKANTPQSNARSELEAVLAGKITGYEDVLLVIDGKVASYAGERPRFTPDGKHVVCVQTGNGNQTVLFDGKPMMTASKIEEISISSTGDIGVIAYGSGGKKGLYLNGKPVPNGEAAREIVFCPDGTTWGASCASGVLCRGGG